MENPESYHSVIAQGENLGIHTWMLFGCTPLTETLPLVQAHPDDAFILFCEADDISTEFLDGVAAVDYLMLAVRYAENETEVFDELRRREMLYAAYRYYNDEDVDEIVSGDFFASAVQVHPVFTTLVAAPDCSEAARKKVYAYLESARKEQIYQTVLWDLQCDNSRVDSIISDDSALAFFDEDGYLHTGNKAAYGDCRNLFKSDLAQILQCAVPK
ncbi:MAG: hypothetical protein LUF30_04895 [Lachnospiraceae bacterium]|nr:hypothetical protein [Lachnospiraceae bacterium]